MKEILYEYQLNATTWAYLASLIMISVYFKFRRFWSVRNLDLIGLILLAPGLLLVAHGVEMVAASNRRSVAAESPSDRAQDGSKLPSAQATPSALEPKEPEAGAIDATDSAAEQKDRGPLLERLGYSWLFAVGGAFLIRMLIDSVMVRRPLLEPNLSAGGLTFACAAMLLFLMSNVITAHPSTNDVVAARSVDKLRAKEETPEIRHILKQRGPGYPLFHVFSSYSDDALDIQSTRQEDMQRAQVRITATRTTAIFAHLAVVLGMLLIGYRHFDNVHTGIAAATLYLLLPYTAEFTPRVDHVVPAALLVWAVQCYRRPIIAGTLIGLAGGIFFYPLFLLPLWCSFYWRRGLLRFTLAVVVVLGLVALSLLLTSDSLSTFLVQLRQTFGVWRIAGNEDIVGFWSGKLAPYRLPVFAAFVALCGSMALWPAQKNLGSLLACSAAIMLGTQFWKSMEGGTYIAWYLPLLILTIFRPNLEDRVALSAIGEGWVRWRRM